MERKYFFTAFVILFLVSIFLCMTFCFAQQQAKDATQGATVKQGLRALIEKAKQKDAEAINQLIAYSLKNPTSGEALIGLAESYSMANDMVNAEKYAKQASAVDPKNGVAYQILAQIDRTNAEGGKVTGEERQTLLDAARGKIKKALELTPEDPWIYVEAALIFSATSDKAGAVTAIEKAAALRPNDADIKSMRSRILSAAK